MKKILLFFIGFLLGFCAISQDTVVVKADTSKPASTVTDAPAIQPDTNRPLPPKPVNRQVDTTKPVVIPTTTVTTNQTDAAIADTIATIQDVASKNDYGPFVTAYIENHPYFDSSTAPDIRISQPVNLSDKDHLFYLMCGLLALLAIIRMSFPKYFQDLLSAFWKPSFRQNQTRDHLQEAGMTTLVFNIFFVLSLGLFACLIILHLKPNIENPLLLYAICVLGILVLYSGKYLVFRLTGWMFGETDIVNAYMFIVFMINKVLSLFLMPLVLILAFSDTYLQNFAFTVSLIMVIILFLYRYTLAFSGLRNKLKISVLHLILFVCGFEIIPVLLIYRSLVQLFERSS